MSTTPQAILFYDGDCAMCNFSVRFAMKKGRNQSLFFSPLQSEFANKTIPEEYKDIDSIILIQGDKVYTKSDVVLQVASHDTGILRFFTFLKFIPKVIRDFVYDFIARNRTLIQTKNETCPVIPTEFRSQFILK